MVSKQEFLDQVPCISGTVKTHKPWVILLLILGSPVWLSVGIAAFAVVISLYISLWAVIISLWAIFASVAACGFAGVLAGVGFALGGYVPTGLVVLGGALVCAGLSIFLFLGGRAVTKGMVLLTAKLAKKCFAAKERKA